MSLEVKKGIVSNLSRTTNNFSRNGNNVTTQEYAWRFDNLQCYGKVSSNIGLSENDELITVGRMKNGTFKVLAMKNMTSGAIVKFSVTINLIAGICFFALGILTFLFIVGFIFFPISAILLYHTHMGYKANNLLDQAM